MIVWGQDDEEQTLEEGTPSLEESSESWRTRYELGAGDVLEIRMFGKPKSRRERIAVTPDGYITYLEVSNFPVAGLTIDEARQALEDALREFYRAPKVIMVPYSLNSKRYTILGKVKRRGVYPLDRPMTLIEAIARSEGIEIGLFEHRAVELADYERSFIVRNKQRLPVNFSELFLQGDLAQNVPLEPGDYIFLASSVSNDYYVLGAVASPGFQGFSVGATVVTAISKRGGFLPTAYREKVLVVRGSLSKPKVHVVNMEAILNGKEKSFKLEPKDIVYVSNRPWAKLEDIIDRATLTFMETAASTWTNANIPAIINRRLLPDTDWADDNNN
ncbi:MAG: polysaccharide biosynthesis/export family protein [Verrucomicrobiota bacterium]